MLRVTIEVIPDGDSERTRTLAQLDIVNDETASEWVGHYTAHLQHFSHAAGGGSAVDHQYAEIRNIERDMVHPVQLTAVALNVFAPPLKRTMAMFGEPPARLVQLDSVPIFRHGEKEYVCMDSIPEPWRTHLSRALQGTTPLTLQGEGACVSAGTWRQWLARPTPNPIG